MLDICFTDADNTVSTNEVGGNRMASLVLRPTIISFLDTITRAGDVKLDLEDIVIGRRPRRLRMMMVKGYSIHKGGD